MNLNDLQKQLENDVKQAAITSRINKNNKNIKNKNESENDYARAIMVTNIRYFTETLQKFLDEALKGVAGVKATSAKILSLFDDLDVVSFLVFKVILDGASHIRTATQVAMAIGQRLDDELRYIYYEQEDKKYFNCMKKHMNDTKHSRYRRSLLVFSFNKKGYRYCGLTKEERLRLGFKMIDIMTTEIGLTKLPQGRGKKYLQLTDKMVDWINKQRYNKFVALPTYLPCVVKPKRWTNPYNGGFHYNFQNLKLLKTDNDYQLMRINEENPEHFYKAVNGLQETGFIVNKKVLEVALQLFENGVEVGCMANINKRPLPPKPFDMATNEIARKKWRKAAFDVHEYNQHQLSKRLQTLLILNTAEKFKDHTFYHVMQADFRGRLYAVTAHFNPQGNDLARALHLFAKPSYIDVDKLPRTELDFLKLHGANLQGIKGNFNNRVTQADTYFPSNRKNYKDKDTTYTYAISGCHKNGNRKYTVTPEIANNRVYEIVDKDPLGNLEFWANEPKPFQFLAYCFERAAYQKRLVKGGKTKFKSHLPVYLDGTNNAYQHIACLCRDNKLAKSVNLISKNEYFKHSLKFDAYKEEPEDLYTKVLDQLMCDLNSIFLANNQLITDWLEEDINREFIKKPILSIPYGGTDFGIIKYIEDYKWKKPKTHEHNSILAKHIRLALLHVSPSVNHVIKYLKDAQTLGLTDGWVTPSGFYVEQKYVKRNSKQVKTKLGNSSVRLSVCDYTDKPDLKKMNFAICANFVQSYDAANVHLAISKALDANLSQFITVHDSYATTCGHIEKFIDIVKKSFVELYTKNDCPLYKNLPPLGNFDVKEVLKAIYIFS